MISPIGLAERGLVPDFVTRAGIRLLLEKRLQECRKESTEAEGQNLTDFVASMMKSPLALNTADANKQHYEVPAAFYTKVLGKNLKYSSCYYVKPSMTLDQAEDAMLALTCTRAELKDGMRILELGCGWGSLSLWMASHYPKSPIVAVSNSASQKAFIDKQAKDRGLKNLTIITCDMNDFTITNKFDRIVSVEMFEHMRNYKMLFERISQWLDTEGKLFFHIFCHAQYAYPFQTTADDDWMGKHFFTGGIMPSFALPLYFQEHLTIEKSYKVDGTHYGQTSEHWLENLDRHQPEMLELFKKYPQGDKPEIVLQRWRIFFMACAELFNYNNGREWWVGHYLFNKRPLTAKH